MSLLQLLNLYLFVFVFRLSTATLSGVEYHFIMQRYYWSDLYYWKYLGGFLLQIVIVIGAWIQCIKVINLKSNLQLFKGWNWPCWLEKTLCYTQDSSKGFRVATAVAYIHYLVVCLLDDPIQWINLFGLGKPFVKLRSAYSVKLVFSYVVKGVKIKITACLKTPSFWRYKENYVVPQVRDEYILSFLHFRCFKTCRGTES